MVPDEKDWTWVLDRPCPDCGFEASDHPRERLVAARFDPGREGRRRGVGEEHGGGQLACRLATEALGKDGLKAYGSMTAFQRMGAPAELGAAAAFLASSDSSFMTASEVAVDGGLAQL